MTDREPEHLADGIVKYDHRRRALSFQDIDGNAQRLTNVGDVVRGIAMWFRGLVS